MRIPQYKIKAKVWLYQGDTPWHFVTIESKDANAIKKEYIWPKRGFGAIPVNVTIGKTSWKTSMFPEKQGTYLLPIKKEVRDKEQIKRGNTVKVTLEIVN